MLQLREGLRVFANLRPATVLPQVEFIRYDFNLLIFCFILHWYVCDFITSKQSMFKFMSSACGLGGITIIFHKKQTFDLQNSVMATGLFQKEIYEKCLPACLSLFPLCG